jgi:hypothetical protein
MPRPATFLAGASALLAAAPAASSSAAPEGPCDIFGAATPPTPCVAAHSMVRAL